MNFLQLQYFCTVAHTGNITHAAQQLRISQSSLSQTLSKLEQELDISLLERYPRGIGLTEAGERFLQYAEDSMRRKQEIMQELHDLGRPLSGQVVIRTNAMSFVVARLFCDFKKLYPNVKLLFIQNGDAKTQLSPQELLQTVDLIVTSDSAIPYRADSVILATEELLAALPPHHKLAHASSIELEELANEDFLVSSNQQFRDVIVNYCRVAGFEPHIFFEYNNTNTLFSLLAADAGVSLFPKSWMRLYSSNIHLVPISRPHCLRTIRLFWSKERQLSLAAITFRDFLIARFGQMLIDNYDF